MEKQTVKMSILCCTDKFMFFPNSQVFEVMARGNSYGGNDFLFLEIKNTVTGKTTRVGEFCDLYKVLVYPVNDTDT